MPRGLHVVFEDHVHGLGLQHAHAVQLASAQDHQAEALVVAGGTEHPVPAHEQGRLHSGVSGSVPRLQYTGVELAADLAEPIHLVRRHPEAAVHHLQRPGQLLTHHLVQGLAGNGLDVPPGGCQWRSCSCSRRQVELERLLGSRFRESLSVAPPRPAWYAIAATPPPVAPSSCP